MLLPVTVDHKQDSKSLFVTCAYSELCHSIHIFMDQEYIDYLSAPKERI